MNSADRVAQRWLQATPPRDIDRGKTYYHGTHTEAAGRSILQSGVIKAPDVTSKNFLTPVKGRVYVTPTLPYAIIYAIGSNTMGEYFHYFEERNKADPYGYLFTIAGRDLADIQPDEDSVGEMLSMRRPEWLWYFAMTKLSLHMMNKVAEGDYMWQAKAGKMLMPHLSDAQKDELIDAGAHIANQGDIPFQQCWQVTKTDSEKVRSNGTNFFDVAKRIR